MLVVAPMIPTTLTSGFICPIASKVPSTPAAPHMSNFMNSIPCAGLMEIPPLSKQSPFPTSTTGFALGLPPLYSSVISLGSWGVPCATARNDPIFSASISLRPRTVIPIPWRFAMSAAVWARYSGVQRLPGIIASRRARL